MSQSEAEIRSYSVHLLHSGTHARILQEASFEAAAVAYAEDLLTPPEEGDEVSLIVRELETGREHCFRVDLATGGTEACA